jgi:hypothetical protein
VCRRGDSERSISCYTILNSMLVGEGGHYLNRPGELRGVLELIRAHRDRLEQCVPLVDARRTILLTPPKEGRETIVGLRLGVPFPG